MKKIIYPAPLKKGDTIGITAPSSGVEEPLHILLDLARERLEKEGYKIKEGATVRNQSKAASASKEKRAKELTDFLLDDDVKAVIPPWGGEILMEILPLLDWEKLRSAKPKWILGYSDTSTLLFSYTLQTGIATAHGTNYIDLNAKEWDDTTKKWKDVLSLEKGESIIQESSSSYQSSWDLTIANPGSGFHLDTSTKWRSLSGRSTEKMKGRLIGGCLNTLSILAGTPFGNVPEFIQQYCKDEGVIWYLESVHTSASSIYRKLWQLKMNGWFEHTNGILFGRLEDYKDTEDLTYIDALKRTFSDLEIPVIYDVDIGHAPPQLTLVNGAYAEVDFEEEVGGKVHMILE